MVVLRGERVSASASASASAHAASIAAAGTSGVDSDSGRRCYNRRRGQGRHLRRACPTCPRSGRTRTATATRTPAVQGGRRRQQTDDRATRIRRETRQWAVQGGKRDPPSLPLRASGQWAAVSGLPSAAYSYCPEPRSHLCQRHVAPVPVDDDLAAAVPQLALTRAEQSRAVPSRAEQSRRTMGQGRKVRCGGDGAGDRGAVRRRWVRR